jgi:hypothetical protein
MKFVSDTFNTSSWRVEDFQFAQPQNNPTCFMQVFILLGVSFLLPFQAMPVDTIALNNKPCGRNSKINRVIPDMVLRFNVYARLVEGLLHGDFEATYARSSTSAQFSGATSGAGSKPLNAGMRNYHHCTTDFASEKYRPLVVVSGISSEFRHRFIVACFRAIVIRVTELRWGAFEFFTAVGATITNTMVLRVDLTSSLARGFYPAGTGAVDVRISQILDGKLCVAELANCFGVLACSQF